MFKSFAVFLKLAAGVLVVGGLSTISASTSFPSCQAGTVATYVNNYSTLTSGCAVQYLDYLGFSYVTTGYQNSPAASAIGVAPSGLGLTFGPVTNSSSTQTVSFEVDYGIVIDPSPIITGDDLFLDVGGTVSVTEYFCNDLAYAGNGLCAGGSSAYSLNVTSTNGQAAANSIIFPSNGVATKSQNVAIIFTLGPNSGFQILNSTSLTNVPEPASLASVLLGFAVLGGGYKLHRKLRA